MGDYITRLQSFLDKELKNKENINVLEAGCGSLSKITFQTATQITGIDISALQLERNKILEKKIQGDLHTYDLGTSNYDVIVCWDVLEHLHTPAKALDNMIKSLTPGGILLIKLPNLMSMKGLITKFSSHKLHVLYYKLVYKQKNAGKDDTGPFKTFLRYTVSPNGLKKYAQSRNLEVPYMSFHDVSDADYFLARLRFKNALKKVYTMSNSLARMVSLGALNKSELVIVLKKPEHSESSKRSDEFKKTNSLF